MTPNDLPADPPNNPAQPPRRPRRLFVLFAALVVYALLAYLLIPLLWSRHEKRHPALASAETITRTRSGIPGDPIDVGLVGTEEQLQRGMLAAKWYPADPITLRSSMRIAAAVVLKRPYDDAPVSPLYLFGRVEDLAFEQPVGDDPRRRHHVRFWKSDKLDDQNRPLWFGSATLDERVGLARDTGQITHHISPDVDAERDKIIADLKAAGWLAGVYWIDGFQKQLSGRNGEGDPWRTDGRLAVGVLAISGNPK